MSLLTLVSIAAASALALWIVLLAHRAHRYYQDAAKRCLDQYENAIVVGTDLLTRSQRNRLLRSCRVQAAWHREQLEAIDHRFCLLYGIEPDVVSPKRLEVYRNVWGHWHDQSPNSARECMLPPAQ